MAPISQDNFNPDIPSSELNQLPEWHCKKWAMSILLRVNGNLLGYVRGRVLTSETRSTPTSVAGPTTSRPRSFPSS